MMWIALGIGAGVVIGAVVVFLLVRAAIEYAVGSGLNW